MSKRFLSLVNLTNLSSDPATGSEGDIYFNTTTDKIRIYINGAWTDLSASIEGQLFQIDSIQYPDYIALDTAPTLTSASPGTLSWDSGEGGLSAQLNDNINITLGQEIIALCYNGTGTTLNKGEVVMVSGAQGQRPRIIRASNISDSTSARTFGIVAESITSGGEGFVITQGIIKNVNTNAFNAGDPLYLSSTPGQLTTTKPKAPEHYVWVGVVLSKSISSGRIYVKPQNGYELDEIHDVRITSASAGDIIVYNSASSLWLNENLTTTIVPEGSNLYYTEARALNSASTLFVHDNHTNITATYNSASNQILLSSQGGGGNIQNAVYSFSAPTTPGDPGDIVYVINSASTMLMGIYEYVGEEWYNVISDENLWNYLLDNDWQYVIDESGVAGWQHLLGGELFVASSSATYNGQYLPNLVAEILYLNKTTASSTYYPISGGTITGNVQVNGSANFIGGFRLASASPSILAARSASPDVSIRWNEPLGYWEFTNDGSIFTQLGSGGGGGALIYQPNQPDTQDLDIGTVWIDSDEPVGSGLDIATYRKWIKTLSASTSTLYGLDDNGNTLEYTQDLENVFINGTLLSRDLDYTATSGSSVILSEAAVSGDLIEIHCLESILFADTYRKTEIDNILDNIDALPSQTGNSGKYLTTNGASASWGVLVIPETASAAFTRWTKVYGASATLISGSDDNAINLEYDLGLEQLFINGVMIARNEYTATSGSTIVLNDALSVNDVVDIYSYQNTNNISTYSQAQIDAKYNQYTRWKKIYSASATVITGNDDNALPLSYTSGYEQVYLNGILLTPITDYTRTSASVITLGQAVVTNDVIEIINTQPFNVANVYTTTQANNIFLTQNAASTTYATQAQVAIIDVDNLPDIFLMMGG